VEGEEKEEDYDLSKLEGWEESPDYLERVQILNKVIPKYKTAEIK